MGRGKALKVMAAVAIAACAAGLAACGREPADRFVGVWKVVGETLNWTVTSVPDGWYMNGSYADTVDYGLEQYPATWTFSDGGILTVTPNPRDPDPLPRSALYSVDGDRLVVLAAGDTILYSIVSFRQRRMVLTTDWYEFFYSGRYTVNTAFLKGITFERP